MTFRSLLRAHQVCHLVSISSRSLRMTDALTIQEKGKGKRMERSELVCHRCARDVKDAYMRAQANKQTKEEREEAKNQFIRESLPQWLSSLEANCSPHGCCVGLSLSLADISLFHALNDYFSSNKEALDEVLASCPKLRSARDSVAALPGVERWLENRPDNSF